MLEKQLKEWFLRSLKQWHLEKNKRQMPWKGEKNPYKIWLSEIILQQTRVEQGLAYYQRFIKKYPTVHHLAQSVDNEVFKLWEEDKPTRFSRIAFSFASRNYSDQHHFPRIS